MIQSKAGKFDMLFCVGEFFSRDSNHMELNEYRTGKRQIPILTYILGTNQKQLIASLNLDENGCDLCENMIYLGHRGLLSTKQGLKIVYLSGLDKNKFDELPNLVLFDDKDCQMLELNCQAQDFDGIDLLFTNQWPQKVETYAKELDNSDNSDTFGSECISRLAQTLKPRYHFSALHDLYYERLPYHNSTIYGREIHSTRFIALAKCNKKNKPKFLYAFNITPMSYMDRKELIKFIPETTQSPYDESQSKKRPLEDEPSLQYFYDAKQIEKMSKKQQKIERKSTHLEPCWFCLGGTQVEKHYIISIGRKSYLAYAKGALNKDHLLILPISHVKSTVISDDETLEDINLYKQTLVKYFHTRKMKVVFYERNFKTHHMQIQVFALPETKIHLLRDAFLSQALQQNIDLNEIPKYSSLKQILSDKQAYFYLELPDDEGKYLCEIKQGSFPLEFGRDVIASDLLLNLPDRIHWKNCILSKEDEIKMTKTFREDFKAYDPSV
jgi:hypothetical protein